MTTERAAGPPAAREPAGLSRRGLLTGAAAFGVFSVARPARAENREPRVAAVDWAMLETALALGVTPVAAAELIAFRKSVVEPAAPSAIADIGLRGSLSYERLLAARPELILISPWYEARAEALRRIAPVLSLDIHTSGRPPYAASVDATRALAARLGRDAEAGRVIAETEADIAAARERVARFEGREALVANLGDARHFRAFGRDSMFGQVIERLGLRVAWAEPTRFGVYSTVGVEALAGMPDAIVANVGPSPDYALAAVRESPLWRAMPAVAAGRFLELSPVNPYGALPSARRFARLMADALQALPRDA